MADTQKIRQTLIEDTILSLRGLLTKEYSIAVTGTFNGETSDLSKEITQQSVLNAITLLTHELQNKNLSYLKDSDTVFVSEDTSDPANNVPLPVKLSSVTGDINITAGDLNVHLSDRGTNFDCTRIGDGITELKINSDGSINTMSTSVSETSVGTITNNDIDTVAKQITTNSTPCKYCIVQAYSINTTELWIGDSNVTAQRGILLFPTDNIRLEIDDVNKLYVYAADVNQGVCVTYFN